MTKQTLIAKVRDVSLLNTDVKTGMERAMELTNRKVRARDKITIEGIFPPGMVQSTLEKFSNKTGQIIPRENEIYRIFPDGSMEYLALADNQGGIRAHLKYMSGNLNCGIQFNWNIVNGGMYANEFNAENMEIKWQD